MIHKPKEVPHFGCWVIQKLLRNSMSNGGQLHCGGMVSIIVEHLGLHLPNNHTNIIPGRTHLSIDVMDTMHLFYCHPNGVVHWTIDGREYIRIDSRNMKILALVNDIPSTNWRHQSNLGVTTARRTPTTTPAPLLQLQVPLDRLTPFLFPNTTFTWVSLHDGTTITRVFSRR
ncbi:unnamed protein product [Lactuca saligna]|uniref:Uncharacterized protein n=1 Tax=Lactuca saligna TaxID=75948 RepID=A0AA35ZKC6_LACSI|nr:unnamed protein product [Lactuca saligna]